MSSSDLIEPEPPSEPASEPSEEPGTNEADSIDAPAAEAEAEARKRAGLLRLKAAVVLPLLFGAAALAYYFLIDGIIADQLTMQARSYAGEGGIAEVDHVSFSIFGPSLTVRELSAWQDIEGREPREIIYVREANLDIEFWPLLERRVVINDISASEVRYQQPWSPETEEESDVPTDTNQPELNDYLQQVKDILESEEVQDLRDLLEELREQVEEEDEEVEGEPGDEPAGEAPAQRTPEGELEPAKRAWYVEEALASREAQPRVIVKHASLDELNITFGREDKNRFAHKVTQLELTAESVSSDPVAYRQAMRFTAAGNLDGKESRRAEIGLTLRFDPDELVSIEQVDGDVGLKSVDISSLVDTDIFGDTLRDARLSVVHYAPSHTDFSGRTQLSMSGSIQPPGFTSPAKASFGIWFGGYQSDNTAAAFMPSGVSIQIEDFPLEPVLNLAGGSPIPLANKNATISFGTVDGNGTYGTPESALSWHDGIKVHLRMQVKGLSFADPEGDLAGLPGTFLVRGLNRVVDGMGGLDVIVGFEGSKNNIALDLEKPGLRAFVDAVVNALTLTAPEIESMIDLPFTVSSSASFGLASMNADGSVRDPKLSLDGEARHDLNDLRVGFNLRDVTIAPKPGESTIAGLPADDFCSTFNNFMQSLGPEGLSIRTRVMNTEGTFSPALESPGLRGIVDAMANTLRYTGAQVNSKFDLPFMIAPNTQIQVESVGTDGEPRTFSSPGADSHDLSNLRLRLRAANFVVSPKAGQANILGIPAKQFCTSFNTFVQAQGQKGVAIDWRILNDAGTFAPQMKQPGTRGLLDGVVNTLTYNGKQLNSTFDLPFKLDDNASIEPRSIEPDGRKRTLTGPDSSSNSLDGMTVAVVLKNGMAEAKPGTKTILGVPADYFTFAWNKLQAGYGPNGMPMRIRLFDGNGVFAPALTYPDEQALLKQVGNAVGINDFLKSYTDLPKRFEKEWPAFQKEGLKVAKDIAEGKWKPPKVPKDLPDVPKLPWD